MALVQKQFGELITFTRSSAGGRFNSAGVFEMIPANQPRFDYDPITRQLRGLLTEEASTNLLLRSSEFSHTVWVATSSGTGVIPSVVQGSHASPDGGINACSLKLVVSAPSDVSSLSQNFLTTTGVSYTTSLWIKAKEEKDVGKQIVLRNTTGFKLITLGREFAREDRNEVANSASNFLRLSLIPSLGTSTDEVECVVWGAQAEAKAFPTTYIPTLASQVTRTPDMPIVNSLSPWWNPQSGTMFVDYTPGPIGLGSTNVGVYMSSTDPAENLLVLRDGPGKGNIHGLVSLNRNDTQVSIVGARNLPLGTNLRVAFSFGAGSTGVSVNGAKVVKSNGITMPTPTRMGIGIATSTQQLSNGHVRAVRYYPRQLTDAELEALTK